MRKKVIIDCDPGIDDSLAIMLALSCNQIEVLGITIVCGNSPTEMGAGNAAKVLRQMNRLDIPIFTGERTPLQRHRTWSDDKSCTSHPEKSCSICCN